MPSENEQAFREMTARLERIKDNLDSLPLEVQVQAMSGLLLVLLGFCIEQGVVPESLLTSFEANLDQAPVEEQ